MLRTISTTLSSLLVHRACGTLTTGGTATSISSWNNVWTADKIIDYELGPKLNSK